MRAPTKLGTTITLASGITLARVALLPVMLFFLLTDRRDVAFALLLAILAGDFLDGLLARLRREVTELGKRLDPVVDKLVFLSVFAALAWQGELPWVAFALLAALQIGVLLGGLLWLRYVQQAPQARLLGKVASLVISAGLIAAFLRVPLAEWIVYGGIALGYAAGVDYLLNFWRILSAKAPSRSQPSSTAEIQAEEGR